MYVLFLNVLYIFFDLKYRSETPPNTPQQARAAARQNERDNRNLDSPEHRCVPHHPNPPPFIPPLILPIPQPLPLPENMAIPDDPFALPPPPPPPPVQQYHHLPDHLAQQLQNLPALAPARGHGRGRGHGHGDNHDNGNGNGNIDHVRVEVLIYLFPLIQAE